MFSFTFIIRDPRILTTALPIEHFLPEIITQLQDNNRLVLQADPGAGKSTCVPLALLAADLAKGKKIVMLEPRRLAAKSIALYLAQQLGEPIGQSVGYQVRNDKCSGKNTRLEIITEGILTRRIQHDPELNEVGLLIFDEFHERSIHADLSLTLSLEIQQVLREDLKLLVMSATIDTQAISAFLDHAPVIICPGRQYPVSLEYLTKAINPKIPEMSLQACLKRIVLKALAQSQGDILVFLPGQREIHQAIETMKLCYHDNKVLFIPLYGGLNNQAQQQAVQIDELARRKVVFSTNVAETSLTIPGITCVIDSGQTRRALFDPSSAMTRLDTCMVSNASAEQRKGRAGRLAPGICYRLWTESQHRQLTPYYEEEIKVTDLSSLALELAKWGVKQPSELSWLTPPPEKHYNQARALLLGAALIHNDGAISDTGIKAIALGLQPRFARMLLTAVTWGQAQLACDIAALLSERDIFRAGQGTDLNARLLALQEYRRNKSNAKSSYPLQVFSTEQALLNSRSWLKKLSAKNQPESCSLTQIHQFSGQLLALAYPDRIAQRRSAAQATYVLSNGKGAFLFNDDPLADQPWLVVGSLDGQKKQGRIYLAAPIEQSDIETLFSQQISYKVHYFFDKQKNKIVGRSEKTLANLVLSSQAIAKLDKDQVQKCLLALIANSQLQILPWSKSSQAWLQRVRWLAQYNDQFPALTQSWLIEHLDLWLLPYLSNVDSVAALQKINLLNILQQILDWQQQKELEQQAPVSYTAPSNNKVAICYSEQGGARVSVVLQEIFGEISSPTLAWNQQVLCFELLSPARRPIQVTSDLQNFWQTSYFDVAKDMRGRYPRHRWPEQPLLEKAGRSIKKHKRS
jgi:ATP-dependent helicase HrpB